MQDASPGQGAPRPLGRCDIGTCLSRQKLEAFPYRTAGPLVEPACLVSEVLTQAGNRNSDAGGHGGDEFRSKGGNLPQKEPQAQRQSWAGPFWELRLPSCKCPGEEGTAEPRWAGTQFGTAPGRHEQGNAACTSLGTGRCLRGNQTGTGRLGEPEGGYGAARPLCSSARTWQQRGRACPWLAPRRAPWGAGSTPRWQDQGAAAHPGITASHWERCWVGQPGAARHGAFPACRSRIVLTWQQQCENCSGRGLAGSAVRLPRPRVSWHRLFMGPWDSQPGPGTAGTVRSPFLPRTPNPPPRSRLLRPSPSPIVG